MSIVPGIPLKLVSSTTPEPSSAATPPLELATQHSSSSTPNSTLSVPTSHIAASPTALIAHEQSTTAVLSTLHPPTDVEDLILLDGTPRRRPPVIPAYCPYRVQLQLGRTYRWCACGRSQRQPWCDDSHGAGDPQPVVFRVGVEQRFHYLCGCKYTSKPPFCDGSHIHAVVGAEEQQRARQAEVRSEESFSEVPPTRQSELPSPL